MLKALHNKQIALSSDRQHFSTNWNDRDRIEGHRSLRTIATVDNITGFVLGSHLNFDYRDDAFSIRERANHIKDTGRGRAFRRYGQYALPAEYIKSEQAKSHKAFARQRRDQERGLLIHETYQMLCHFEFIKPFIAQADNVLWSLDNDAGLANSLVSVYGETLRTYMDASLMSSRA